MANPEHLALLQQGVDKWNAWREANPECIPDLSRADLRRAHLSAVNFAHPDLPQVPPWDLSKAQLPGANLEGALLFGADLTEANLEDAILNEADLDYANLSRANLNGARLGLARLWSTNLVRANLRQANLSRAQLKQTNLTEADLTRADLSEANLQMAKLVQTTCVEANFTHAALVATNFEQAVLTNARIYGISAWDLQLTGAVQRDLIITPAWASSTITVDNLELAQFIYLLLNNQHVRNVIDTITSKVVLILGRFTPERKPVLDAVREKLRNRNYLPVLFDFEKPSSRDLTETVSTLAHMAKFVIADLTDAKSLPQELASIVPFLPSVPVQPILLASEREYAMYEHFPAYPWVLPIAHYETAAELLVNLAERVIAPAERRLAAGKGSG